MPIIPIYVLVAICLLMRHVLQMLLHIDAHNPALPAAPSSPSPSSSSSCTTSGHNGHPAFRPISSSSSDSGSASDEEEEEGRYLKLHSKCSDMGMENPNSGFSLIVKSLGCSTSSRSSDSSSPVSSSRSSFAASPAAHLTSLELDDPLHASA